MTTNRDYLQSALSSLAKLLTKSDEELDTLDSNEVTNVDNELDSILSSLED